MRMKAEEEELRKQFRTAVSRCVHSGVLSAERARGFSRSGELHASLSVCVWRRVA